jgi:hypothetical protein
MATNRHMDLLATDPSARVDPSKRMLAGLPAGRLRRRRWRIAGVAAVLTAAAFLALGLRGSPPHGTAASVVHDDPLPAIPFDPLFVRPEVPRAVFDVITPERVARRLATAAFVSGPTSATSSGKRTRRATRPPSFEVAVLSVLVEHIDAERRTAHATPPGVK